MSQTVAAILFDKDGTLFDFSRTWDAWGETILRRLSKDAAHLDRLAAAVDYDLAGARFREDSIVIAGTPFEIAEALERHLPDMTLAAILTLLNVEAAREPQVPAVALGPLMAELAATGLRLGVATNDAEAPARAHLASAGILDQFDFIAGCDSGYGGKPAPGQLLAFAAHIGLAPGACVMVGDSRHDLAAGRSAGFATVGVLTGAAAAEDLADLADVVLQDVGHLPGWLAARG